MRYVLVVKKDDNYYGVGTIGDVDVIDLRMTPSQEMAFREFAETIFLGELRTYPQVVEWQKIMKEIEKANNCEIHVVGIDHFEYNALRDIEQFSAVRLSLYRRLKGRRSIVIVSPDYWKQAATAIIGTVRDNPEEYVKRMEERYHPFGYTTEGDESICTMDDYFVS